MRTNVNFKGGLFTGERETVVGVEKQKQELQPRDLLVSSGGGRVGGGGGGERRVRERRKSRREDRLNDERVRNRKGLRGKRGQGG